MPAPYGIDLRTRIVETARTEKINLQQVAERFKVSLSTVKNYCRQYRRTGKLSPLLEKSGRPGKIDAQGYQTLQAAIDANPTLSLRALAEHYYEHHRIKLSLSMVWRACVKLKLRYKKLSLKAAEQLNEDVKKKSRLSGGDRNDCDRRFCIYR